MQLNRYVSDYNNLNMPNLDFWDFMLEGGYDLLFPDDEDAEYGVQGDASNF